MVWPTRPNSATGHQARMNRASEVPPLVLSSGSMPSFSRIAPATRLDSGPGSVRKASPLTVTSSR